MRNILGHGRQVRHYQDGRIRKGLPDEFRYLGGAEIAVQTVVQHNHVRVFMFMKPNRVAAYHGSDGAESSFAQRAGLEFEMLRIVVDKENGKRRVWSH